MQRIYIILCQIVPIFIYKINYDLRRKNSNIETPNNLDQIDIQDLRDDYKASIEVKNKIEDKAKAIIITLTIAISMILNLSEIVNEAITKIKVPYFEYIIFVISLCSILYMLCASIMSMQILLKENILYFTSLEERTIKTSIYQAMKQNNNQNLIRNNLISVAYISIRNSIICLLVIFALAVLPYQSINAANLVNDNCYTEIMYKNNIINHLMNNFQKKFNWSKIFQNYTKSNNND